MKLLPFLRHNHQRCVCFTATAATHTKQFEIPVFQRQERRSMATKRRQQRQRQQKQGGSLHTSSKKKRSQSDNKHNKQRQQHERVAIRPPKNYLNKLPIPKERISIPPALLAATASPYVYISKTALGGDVSSDCDRNGNDSSETSIDASTLFSEVAQSYGNNNNGSDDDESYYDKNNNSNYLPPLFSKGDFEYFSPKNKSMNYGYPVHGIPEVAFLGRSNVGKSSLVNALMRKNLCVTSKSPGRTQLPYYYGLISKVDQERQRQQKKGHSAKKDDPSAAQGFIVDLPGYGFGRAPMSITEDWQKDTQDLLLHRRHEAGVLKRLFLLMDARRGVEGPNEHDRIVIRWLEDAEIPFTVVLTKADRVSVPLVVKQVNDFCLRYASQQQHQQHQDDEDDFGVAQSPIIQVTSSKRGWGINELMLSIETEFCGENYDDDNDVSKYNS
mmetsp:Transcript_24258/g.27127  ORF Transcript_24258/g.27127 Transcript_24258/m.27127 type:complete len:442 (+) Transcript_24258:2-1327(+)